MVNLSELLDQALFSQKNSMPECNFPDSRPVLKTKGFKNSGGKFYIFAKSV